VGFGHLDSSGDASVQFLAVPGSTRVHAVYSGDSVFSASTSPRTPVRTTTPYLVPGCGG